MELADPGLPKNVYLTDVLAVVAVLF